MVPIFIKDKTGVLEIIPAFNKGINVDKDSKLVYLGKQFKR